MTMRILFRRFIVVLLVASSGLIMIAGSPAVAQQRPAMGRQEGADNEYQTGATLWQQTSAEYRALAYQAFRFARMVFDQDSKQPRRVKKPRAIIVDVDETVLDNSRFQAESILSRQPYNPQAWSAWCRRAEATAVPGAVDFLSYASRKGARVFYVTNRSSGEKECTIKNLQQAGFPDANGETVIVRKDDAPASKESRRQEIALRYRIVLLMGDNLNDFSDLFSGKSIPERAAEVDRNRSEFGARFIVLPNPMYGDWENAVYDNKSGLSDSDKRSRRLAALKGL